jgi:ribosomal protein S18 acetylase RimI-like enzyme
MTSLTIRLVTPDEQPEALGLLAWLNPDLEVSEIQRRMNEIMGQHDHYELYGAFNADNLIAVCGAWVATKLWCGRYLEVDNIVTAPEYRSKGAGTLLLNHMESVARERNCEIMVLDSYASNTASHRLYHRLGYEIKGFHFVKGLRPILNPSSSC